MATALERTKGIPSSRLIQLSPSIKSLFVVLGFLLLAACGGGGGSNSGGSGQGNNSNITMSLSPQTVSVSAMTSQAAPVADVEVDVAGLSLNQEVYIGITYTGNGVANATIVPGGTLPATASIQFKSPASLGSGTYNDTVTVNVCFDQACSQPVSNSPQTIQVQYTVTKSTFVMTSLSPASAYVGAQGFTLTVNGSTFTQQSAVLWNGNPLSTAYISSSQLTAQVPATDIATAGSVMVSVNDPTYGTSNTETFTVNPSPLTLTALSPATINAGSPAFTLTLTGTSFTSQSTVLWNANPLTTTFASATQLTVQVPATDVTTPGSATVSVSDPTYGGSNSETFTITPPPLALNSISPTTVTVGGPSFTLTALGTAFTGTSTVKWNGVGLVTTLVSSTELLAQVPTSDISATGTVPVTVSDPNSPPGITSAQTLTIASPSKDAVAFQMNPAHTGAVTFNSVSFPTNPTWSVNVSGTPSYALIADGKVIVTVNLSNGNSEVLALDQVTGNTVWGPILMSGVATAAYDNGSVFVLSGAVGAVAVLQALDANTGAVEWSADLTGRYVFTGLPTAADGAVYAQSEGTVNAVNETNGAILWTQNAAGGVESTPAVTADGVYTGYLCQATDLRPATGEVVWSNNYGCNGGGGGMPAVANGLDYADNLAVGFGGDILNAETGANQGAISADTPPAFTATMGYLLQSGTLRGVALPSNTVQWSFAGDGQLSGAPIAVNQYVFIGSSSGNLYALDGNTGTQVWMVTLGSAIDTNGMFSGLAAGDGLLVVPAGNTVTAYTLSTNP